MKELYIRTFAIFFCIIFYLELIRKKPKNNNTKSISLRILILNLTERNQFENFS